MVAGFFTISRVHWVSMEQPRVLKFADFFVLRTPLLPSASLDELRKEYAAASRITASSVVRDSLVQEAMFLASSSIYAQLSRQLASESDSKYEMSVARYCYRMATRCTPFGLFAGITVGKIGLSNRLSAGDALSATRVCRIDHAVVSEARDKFATNLALDDLQELHVGLTTSLWLAPDGFRFVETTREGGKISYRMIRLDETEALTFVRLRLDEGLSSAKALASDLADRFGQARGDAEEFIRNLLTSQFLVFLPEQHVIDNGMAPPTSARRNAKSMPAAFDFMGRTAGRLAGVGPDPVGNIAIYQSVTDELRGAGIDVDQARAIQVDLHKMGGAPELSDATVKQIAEQSWEARVLLVENYVDDELHAFAEAFEARYGSMSIPLLEALDDDFGIGFGGARLPSSLIEGFGAHRGEARKPVAPAALDHHLLRLATQAITARVPDVHIAHDELAQFSDAADEMPSSFYMLGSFESKSLETFSKGEFVFDLKALYGPPASALLSRFCLGNPELEKKVQDFVAMTERDSENALVAEVAHMPSGRTGNILLRPVLHSHDIMYMGGSASPPSAHIKASDLMVKCADGTVTLFCPTLKKTVIPRITSAHNYSAQGNLPVYRFLGALQRQGEPKARPRWGMIAEQLPYLPTLRYRNLILARARWRLTAQETKRLAKMERDIGYEEFLSRIQKSHFGPSVRLMQGDNFLDLDLRAELDRALFVDECRRNAGLTVEMIEDRAPDLARDDAPSGFRHEVVIPFFCRQPTSGVVNRITVPGDRAPSFPGSDWLYARIHGGPSVVDRLIETFFPAVEILAKRHDCSKLFFIRYGDGGHHLRLRMQGDSEQLWGPIRLALEHLLSPYTANRSVSRVEYGTYQPEIDRYGGAAALSHCEHIFAADSSAVSSAIGFVAAGGDEAVRWRYGLASIFRLIRAFELGVDTEIAIAARMAAGYSREFSFGNAHRGLLNRRYREHRDVVDELMMTAKTGIAGFDEALHVRDSRCASHVAGIAAALPDEGAVFRVVGSLCHMSANRLFSENARFHELLLFHFIAKSLASLRGRAKFSGRQVSLDAN